MSVGCRRNIFEVSTVFFLIAGILPKRCSFRGFPFSATMETVRQETVRQETETAMTLRLRLSQTQATYLHFPSLRLLQNSPFLLLSSSCLRNFFPALSVMEETRDISLTDDSDDQSWHSPFGSTPGESSCEIRFSGEIDGTGDPRRDSSASECSLEIDLESGGLEMKEHLGKLQRDCRICQLELAGNGEVELESSTIMELGCSCKGDLGAAHKHCAEIWFKIRGNRICEICGTTALNIANDQINEVNIVNAAPTSSDSAAPAIVVENQTCWHGRRLMNFMFTCMLVGFVVSWLFHFKIIS